MTTSAQKDFLISHIVDKLTEFLLLDNDMELADALNVVYHSRVYQLLQDEDSFLYAQSPSYVYELLKKDMDDVKDGRSNVNI